jgi:3-methylcrotonyl-CoA carboxylase alpha subunit
VERLQAALAGTRVAGVRTNLAFLAALAAHPAFADGGVDTGFIAAHRAELLEPVAARAGRLADPWDARDGWRLNGPAEYRAEPAASGGGRGSTPAVGGPLTSPMPGRITAIHVGAGAPVRRGAVLLVLEAMKMEHSIVAPADGVVSRLNVSVGTQVEEGVELLVIEPLS